ncbi:MAG: porin [Motiliproteus sp.]|nr:porin [Motiliproteus sp.]MCW9054217.1 porin [Motiliproteus sp.]
MARFGIHWVAASLLICTAVHASEASKSGPLFRHLFGDALTETYGVVVDGWMQAGAIANDNGSDDVARQGFLNSDEGLNLNQLALRVRKVPEGNVIGRVGPFPGEMPAEVDVGFNVTVIYGQDSNFFKTYGLDDDYGINDITDGREESLTLTQAFLDIYLPVLGGSKLMLGLFHTPLENEIGFAYPPPAPTDFYTHSYSFMAGPAKHAGALYSVKLPSVAGQSMTAFEIGLVRGWNNLSDPNNDLDVIANLRWRSADFSTWVDWENIYGNGADDSFADCACGSPIPTVAGEKNADRYLTYLTVSKVLDGSNRVAVEFSYGQQEKAGLESILEGQTSDAEWYGANLNWYHRLNPTLMWNSRLEWFNAEDATNLVLTGAAFGLVPSQWSTGEFYGLTTKLSWMPNPSVRLRTELRYDHQDSSGPGAFADGSNDSQLLGAVDLTLYY